MDDHIAALEAALHTEAMNLPLEVLFGVLAEVKRLRAENEALKRPLRDSEIQACASGAFGISIRLDGELMRFARAIEAAHIKAAQAAKEQ